MTHIEEAISIAAVGYGYWGPNVVRNLVERPEFDFRALCELSDSRGAEFQRRHPGVPVEKDFDAILADDSIEAVAIATRPYTHYGLVRRALAAGKHVLVEKPLATTSEEALELFRLAEESDLVLMPGHTFLYSPPVLKVRELIDEGVLGETYFVTSSRMNLGQYQPDGVVWDLAPHDLSILMYWIDRPLVRASATGCSAFQEDVPETAFLTLTFEGGLTANVQLSWLAPRKVRQMVIVGSQRMVQYDDTMTDEPIRIYDRGLDFELGQPENFGEYKLTYRSGDLVVPRLEPSEPLSLELQDFATAIRTGSTPRSHAGLGVRIVQALEAIDLSLANDGSPVELPEVGPLVLVGRESRERTDPFPRWQEALEQSAVS